MCKRCHSRQVFSTADSVRYVYLRKGRDLLKRRGIDIGIADTRRVHIISGLVEGDEVALMRPLEFEGEVPMTKPSTPAKPRREKQNVAAPPRHNRACSLTRPNSDGNRERLERGARAQAPLVFDALRDLLVLGAAALVGMLGAVKGLLRGMETMIYETGGIERISVMSRPAPESQREIAQASPGPHAQRCGCDPRRRAARPER